MENKIYNTVEACLRKADIRFSVEEDVMFRFGIKSDHANFDVRILCAEEIELLVTVVTCAICVPKDKIDRMCRWIADRNHEITLGEFQLDTTDGELSFRIACPLDGGAVNEDIVAVAYVNAIQSFDNDYEEIMKAIYLDSVKGDD